MAREMKDSGIEWIGEIPAEWGIRKIKNSFTVVSGATPKSENPDYWDGDIPWITPADYKTIDKTVSTGKRFLSQAGYESCGTTLVPSGSIVFSKRAPVGTVAVADNELCTNQGCLSCIPKAQTDSLYFYYAMSVFTEQFELVSTGTTFKEIPADTFSNFMLPFPSAREQRIISAFLDEECSRIDSVIDQTRASIEEYKKLKQAVITQAVTKGIRPDRQMKDSGVEWIGEIPDSWDVLSFTKSIDSIVDYRGKTPEKQDEGTLLVTARNIKDGEIDYSISKEYVRTEDFDEIMHRGKVEIGDVLFTTEAPLGAVANADRTDFALAQRIIKFRGKYGTLDNYYLKYWIMSDTFQQNLSTFSTGSTALGIKASKLGMLKQVLPPFKEQRMIVEYLDSKMQLFAELINQKKALLSSLESYKKSLIYEDVTGKKEVPA